MRMRTLCMAVLVVFVVWTPPAFAEREFAIKGVGQITCSAFLEARADRTNLYWNAGGWIDGYITAYNRRDDDTFDIAAFSVPPPSDFIVNVLGNHCRDSPDDPIGIVVRDFVEFLRPTRLTELSEATRVEVEGDEYVVYEEVLRRAQTVLAGRGHYDGPEDGRFSAELEQALAAYQESEGLSPTGAPTDQTLLRLLLAYAEDE